CPRSRGLRTILISPLLWRRIDRSFERHAEMRARPLGQKLQRGSVGVGKLARDIESQPRAAGTGGEERLEDLRPQLGGDARPVVGKLAYYGIAHVSGPHDDANAGVFLLAVLPGITHQVPHDLVHVP